MHRIPPSQKVGKKTEELLKQGLDGEADVTTLVARLGIEQAVQEMVEHEVTNYLERGHYERAGQSKSQEHRGYRNGYEPGRIRTAEGEIVVQVPQVRDAPETCRSRLMTFLRGNSDVLERLAVEMYARGLSTRDIEDALEEATGDRLLSRTAVSQISEVLWDEYEAFAELDLSGFEVEYLFLDAVYESLRQQGGGKEGVMCAWAICADGRKAMLHLALGNKESYANWLGFLRDMVRRGLQNQVEALQAAVGDLEHGLKDASEKLGAMQNRATYVVAVAKRDLDNVSVTEASDTLAAAKNALDGKLADKTDSLDDGQKKVVDAVTAVEALKKAVDDAAKAIASASLPLRLTADILEITLAAIKRDPNIVHVDWFWENRMREAERTRQ